MHDELLFASGSPHENNVEGILRGQVWNRLWTEGYIPKILEQRGIYLSVVLLLQLA
jgi:hypothetical protein